MEVNGNRASSESAGQGKRRTTPAYPQLLPGSGTHQHHPTVGPGLVALQANPSSPYGHPGSVHYQATYPAPIQATINPMYLPPYGMPASQYGPANPSSLFYQDTSTHASGVQKTGFDFQLAGEAGQSMLFANGLVAPDNGSEDGNQGTFGSVSDTLYGLSPTPLEHHDQLGSDEQRQESTQRSHPQNMCSPATPPFPRQPLINCPVPGCRETFMPTQESMVNHFRDHPGMTECPWPDCNSGADSIVQHALDAHCGLRYFCPLCLGWQFKSERSKNRHCRDCPGQSLDPVTCAMCMLQWENLYYFALHVPQCVGPSRTKVKTSSRRRTSGAI